MKVKKNYCNICGEQIDEKTEKELLKFICGEQIDEKTEKDLLKVIYEPCYCSIIKYIKKLRYENIELQKVVLYRQKKLNIIRKRFQ
jgi:hypothetical protein